MASVLRYSALAAVVVTAVSAYAPRDIPTQTVGYGLPFHEVSPTEAPSMELVKKQLEKKAVTNICTEWTIEGGGQPECFNSETCLFTSAYPYYYEGCGQTSIAYNWVTECWNYPQVGVAPISQIYCSEAAPSCGFYAFVFGAGYTYYNFGCSSTSYASWAYLLSTTDNGAAASSSSTIELAGGGTSRITEGPATVTVTSEATPSSNPSILGFGGGSASATSSKSLPTPTPNPTTQGSSQSSSGTQPIINSHTTSKSTPIGAIVGGVIGGIALIAFLAFLAWFLLRKRRQDKTGAQSNVAQVQQQQADAATAAAFHNHQRISEMGGTAKPAAAYFPPPGMYANAGNEKPAATANAQEVYRPPPNTYGSYGNENPGSQSPPPVYAHPPPNQHSPASPHSGYTELDVQGRPTSVPPVSLATTYPSMNELGGNNRASYQMPPNVQEMSGATGGVGRRPVGAPQAQPQVDMSGNPMNENWNHHELE